MSLTREEKVVPHLLHIEVHEKRTLGRVKKVDSQDERENPKCVPCTKGIQYFPRSVNFHGTFSEKRQGRGEYPGGFY